MDKGKAIFWRLSAKPMAMPMSLTISSSLKGSSNLPLSMRCRNWVWLIQDIPVETFMDTFDHCIRVKGELFAEDGHGLAMAIKMMADNQIP